jgi:hypothetical protein
MIETYPDPGPLLAATKDASMVPGPGGDGDTVDSTCVRGAGPRPRGTVQCGRRELPGGPFSAGRRCCPPGPDRGSRPGDCESPAGGRCPAASSGVSGLSGAAGAFDSNRPAVLSLIVLFFVGIFLLTRADVKEGHRVVRKEDANAAARLAPTRASRSARVAAG